MRLAAMRMLAGPPGSLTTVRMGVVVPARTGSPHPEAPSYPPGEGEKDGVYHMRCLPTAPAAQAF